MAMLTETESIRSSTEAGEHFVDLYYAALNGSRHTIKQYYVPTTPIATGQLPHIIYNGQLIQDAAQFQEKFEKEMPWTHFEPQSVNVLIMNPSIAPSDGKSKRDLERNMSLTVQVSGYVRLEERKEGPMRGFSDHFVLVPNKEEAGGRGPGKAEHGKKWLIQTQNFRFVV